MVASGGVRMFINFCSAFSSPASEVVWSFPQVWDLVRCDPREGSVQVPGSGLGRHPPWWVFLDLQITQQYSPPHPILTPHIFCILLWVGGSEELILNAEVAPEDPGNLQGIKGEEGEALSWFLYRHSTATYPGEAGDGGIWTPRPSSSLPLGWGDPRNTTLDLMPR